MKATLLVLASLLSCLIGSNAEAEDFARPQKIRLAISTLAEPSTNHPLISLTVDALQKEFGPQNVDVKIYQLNELEKVIGKGGSDVFISSSGTFRRLADSGARSIGTIVSEKLSDPNKSEGSALIVRSDRKDLIHLRDLKGKVVAANMPNGFSGHLMILHEIYKQGYNPKKFFQKTIFVGHDVEKIVEKVLNGELDGGIIRTCYWEEYADRHNIDKNLIRVVDAKKDSAHACQHTSELFPNWIIATTPSATPEIARRVVKSILSVEPSPGNGLYWGLSTDFTQLDQLLKDLEIGPYEVKKEEIVQAFLKHYWNEILIVFSVILVFLLHHFRVQYLVRKRTAQLTQAHRSTRLIEAKYQKMQKVGIVGLLSSTVAHEIRQPLGAIQFFAKGLENNLKKLKTNEITDQHLLMAHNIVEEAQKADETIKRIRKLAREGQTIKGINIRDEIERLIQDAVKASCLAQKPDVKVEQTGDVQPFHGDQLCFDLVFSNILRNACEYICNEKKSKLDITIKKEGNFFVITVINNGPKVDMEAIESSKLFSGKQQGMGFGLPIAIGLVDNMGGKITFEENPVGGLKVFVKLPAGENR